MKRGDTLMRLKRFRVDDLKRRMATLDGMKADLEKKLTDLLAGRAITEASGRGRLENVRAIALAGVDWISVGSLTHSAPALDLALDFE